MDAHASQGRPARLGEDHAADAVSPGVVAQVARADANRIAVQRLAIAVALVVLVLPLYAILDRIVGQPSVFILDVIKLVVAVSSIVALAVLRTRRGTAWVRPITLALLVLLIVGSSASSVLSGDYNAHALLTIMAPLFTGALIPWGAAYQLAAVMMLLASAVGVTLADAGSLAPLIGYSTVIGVATWMVSLYLAREMTRTAYALTEQSLHRTHAQERLAAEARIAASLAQFGRELIACTERSALLQRVCEMTCELIPCDCSWTTIRNEKSGEYRIVAYHGIPTTMVESMAVVSVPARELDPLLDSLRGGIVERDTHSGVASIDRLRDDFDIRNRLYVPLWQGHLISGFHAAAYRGSDGVFDQDQKRLLVGIGQLASLALESNRLIEELERASRFKSDFVANMSHELRTPLNVILGYHELLLNGTFGTLHPEQGEVLERVDSTARELLDLINATLDLSRLDNHEPGLDLSDVAPEALLDELRQEMSVAVHKPDVRTLWEVDGSLPCIRTDRLKLRMILKNVVHNALKFTERGTVRVQATAHANGIRFVIRDTGIGIAPEEHEKLFVAFHQADPSHSAAGVGLGLYIVQRLITILGGSVEFESTIGVGSTFRIWIPSCKEPPLLR